MNASKHFIIYILIILYSPFACAIIAFEAEYEVLKNGKKTAKQTTHLKYIPHNDTYQLTDSTIGTKGLASLLGFSRQESTVFKLKNQIMDAIQHTMQQKISFKKRIYSFEKQKNNYFISYKGKNSKIPLTSTLISSHAIPINLSLIACQNIDSKEFTILKSSHPKKYKFQFKKENNLIKAERIYPNGVARKTYLWLNPQQHCLPVKSYHQEGDKDPVETRLINLKTHL